MRVKAVYENHRIEGELTNTFYEGKTKKAYVKIKGDLLRKVDFSTVEEIIESEE